MDITEKHRAQQEAKRLENRISSFKENFRIGTAAQQQRDQETSGCAAAHSVHSYFYAAV